MWLRSSSVNGLPDPFAALPCCPFRLSADRPALPPAISFASSGHSERRSGHDQFTKNASTFTKPSPTRSLLPSKPAPVRSQLPWHRRRFCHLTPGQCRSAKPIAASIPSPSGPPPIASGFRSWHLGHISPVAGSRAHSPQGREIFHHHLLRDLESAMSDTQSSAMTMIAAIAASLPAHRACSTSHRSMVSSFLQSSRSIDRIDPCVAAEAFIASTGANITVAGERAFYNRVSRQHHDAGSSSLRRHRRPAPRPKVGIRRCCTS
jgi:hypothetical protein